MSEIVKRFGFPEVAILSGRCCTSTILKFGHRIQSTFSFSFVSPSWPVQSSIYFYSSMPIALVFPTTISCLTHLLCSRYLWSIQCARILLSNTSPLIEICRSVIRTARCYCAFYHVKQAFAIQEIFHPSTATQQLIKSIPNNHLHIYGMYQCVDYRCHNRLRNTVTSDWRVMHNMVLLSLSVIKITWIGMLQMRYFRPSRMSAS